MKRSRLFKRQLQACLGLGLMVAVLGAFSGGWVSGEETKPAKEPAASKESKPAKEPKKKEEKKKLTGAELYAMHCNRCHPERYATERSATQWKTLMLHMRVRANLPANQAKTVMKY